MTNPLTTKRSVDDVVRAWMADGDTVTVTIEVERLDRLHGTTLCELRRNSDLAIPIPIATAIHLIDVLKAE